MRPFVFRFAELIPNRVAHMLRYDIRRQISQILVAGEWIDAPDAPGEAVPGTSITATRRETTDDV